MRLRFILAWALLLAGLCCVQQSSAFWQSRDSNYNISEVATNNPAVATFESHNTTTCAAGVCTGVAQAAGSPNPNDVMAVGICGRGTSYTVTGVTYNTNAMTQVSGVATAGSMTTDIWYITGSGNAGSTATIGVTWSNVAIVRTLISLYKINTQTPTPSSGAGNIATAASVAEPITINSNGIAIAFGCYQAPTSPAFVNATLNDTLTSTNAITAGQLSASATVTANGNTPGNGIGIALAAWNHD